MNNLIQLLRQCEAPKHEGRFPPEYCYEAADKIEEQARLIDLLREDAAVQIKRIAELEVKLAKLEPVVCGSCMARARMRNESYKAWKDCPTCRGDGHLPATHVMVLREPNTDMYNAAITAFQHPDNRHGAVLDEVYKAMIQAAREEP